MEFLTVGSWLLGAFLLALLHRRVRRDRSFPGIMLLAATVALLGGYAVRILGFPGMAVRGFDLAQLAGALVGAELALRFAISARVERRAGPPPVKG